MTITFRNRAPSMLDVLGITSLNPAYKTIWSKNIVPGTKDNVALGIKLYPMGLAASGWTSVEAITAAIMHEYGHIIPAGQSARRYFFISTASNDIKNLQHHQMRQEIFAIGFAERIMGHDYY